jgi:glutathione S-transferase
MTLTIHHLGVSASERILWLCEEIGLPYRLVKYDRDPQTRMAPPAYRALHPFGTAPVIEEDGLVLAESGAIVEYLLARHGGGRLIVGPADPAFAEYLFWFHFANGSMLPGMLNELTVRRLGSTMDAGRDRAGRAFTLVEERLGCSAFFAGAALTAADIMMVFPLTTMRAFAPRDLAPYPHIRAYLQRIGERPAYRAAMAKGDPDMAPLLV